MFYKQLMTSTNYAVREIDIDLKKYALVLKRRWPIALTVCLLTTLAAVMYASLQADTYQAEAKLLIEGSDQVSALVGLENSDRELKALTNQNNPLDTQVEIFRSIPVAQQVIDRLDIRDGDGLPIEPETLLKDLEVSPIPGTDVLRITYEHANPNFAAGVVSAAISVYLERNVQASRSDATAAQDFIAEQLPASEAQVDAAASELRQFKESNGIVEIEAESLNTVEVLTTLDSSVTSLKAQLADTRIRAVNLQQQLQLDPQQAYTVGVVSESPGVQEVLSQLQSVQAQLAVASTRYRATHPEITNLRTQLDSLSALLNQRVVQAAGSNLGALPDTDLQSGELEQALIAQYLQLESERAGLAQQLAQLANAMATQQSRAQALPSLEAQHRELSRKLTAAQGTYETLLESLQQAQVIRNQDLEKARIVSPALVPTESSGASKLLYLLAGGFVGSLLGVMMAFIADLLDRSIETVQEGQKLYDYPLLGVIPAWRKISLSDLEAPRLALTESQTVPLVESYQSLQSNLKFSYFDKPLQSIAVTSAVSGEGKSEVVANLALTLSQLGHRVLIIDTDMRSPAQQHIWGFAEPQGLSNFVAGQIPLERAIIRRMPNLHILSVGSIPPNPLAVLESAQMANLMKACEKTYDYVIVDTPPVLGLADTPTVGRLVNGVLMVMQTGLSDRDSIRAAKSVLTQSRQRVLGIVANGVKVKSRQDRYFYHSQEAGDRGASRLTVNLPGFGGGTTAADAVGERLQGAANGTGRDLVTGLSGEVAIAAAEAKRSPRSVWSKSGEFDPAKVNQINAATATVATFEDAEDS